MSKAPQQFEAPIDRWLKPETVGKIDNLLIGIIEAPLKVADGVHLVMNKLGIAEPGALNRDIEPPVFDDEIVIELHPVEDYSDAIGIGLDEISEQPINHDAPLELER